MIGVATEEAVIVFLSRWWWGFLPLGKFHCHFKDLVVVLSFFCERPEKSGGIVLQMCTIQGVHCGAQLDIDSQGAPGDILGSWESSTMGMSTQRTKKTIGMDSPRGDWDWFDLWWIVMRGSCCTGNNFMIFLSYAPCAAWDGTFVKKMMPKWSGIRQGNSL